MNEVSIRNLARALALGAIAALVIDAVLRNALGAAQSPGVSSMTPWWITGRVVERSIWVVTALLLWGAAGSASRLADGMWPANYVLSRSAGLRVVGRLMIAMPGFWLLATWLVLATRFTAAGTWGIDGQLFLTTTYYNNVLLGYLPWAGGGITLLVLSRHAGD